MYHNREDHTHYWEQVKSVEVGIRKVPSTLVIGNRLLLCLTQTLAAAECTVALA